MGLDRLVAAAAVSLLAASCASAPQQGTPAAEQQAEPAEEQIIGTAAPGSGFSKLTIGMDMDRTQDIMGSAPAKFHSYESGKRWIPFYFGSDARRMQVLYRGEGCLIFTGGNAWGGGGGELIQIENDPSGACYQP